MSRRRRSTDLPPDMLSEISGRLHHTADFVRFHAVCRSWRDSYSRDVPMSRTNQFLPCLLSPNDKDNESFKIRCVFSKTSYRAPAPAHRRSWVANADGTAVRYFTAGPDSGLHDPLTGAHTLPLPPFPQRSSSDQQWEQEVDPAGIVYGDGTILLFSDSTSQTRPFRAALLRPGDATWTLVERNLIPNRYGELCVVCHGGKIMVTVEGSQWHVIATNNGVAVEEYDLRVQRTWLPRWGHNYYYHHCYALETRGELLWLSVEVDLDYLDYPELCFSLVESLRVFVLTLQEVTTAEGPEKLMWVRKDGRSLADVVLFLGWPNSFAMDASHELGGDGGCAYFVYEDSAAIRRGQAAVFRYNFVDEEAELVEWLPEGWHDENCTWLVPQPTIAPIQSNGRLGDKAMK